MARVGLLVCMLVCVAAMAQEPVLVVAPSTTVAATSPFAERPRMERDTHRFFDRDNVALTGLNLTAQIADAVTTQHLLSRSGRIQYRTADGVRTPYVQTFRETNPLARPFVTRGGAGAAAYVGIVMGADLGLRYLFHRTRHHKLERAVPVVFSAISGFAAAGNARQY